MADSPSTDPEAQQQQQQQQGGSQLPDALHHLLIKTASRTITFLNNLTTEHTLPNGLVVKAAMPLTAFRGAKALAFVFRRKYALLGSFEREVGFVTRKNTDEQGNVSWSPPLFVHSHLFGLGLSLGYISAGICAAVLDDVALAFCMKSRFTYNAKGQFLVDMDGAQVRKMYFDSTSQEDNVQSDSRSGTRANYFRAEAMLVDFSLNLGYLRQWKAINSKIYGAASIDDILAGKVPYPSEFSTVQDLLKLNSTVVQMSSKQGTFTRSRSGTVRDSSIPREGSWSRGMAEAEAGGQLA